MLNKLLLAGCLLAASNASAADPLVVALDTSVIGTALWDSVSTEIALSRGARELNPIMAHQPQAAILKAAWVGGMVALIHLGAKSPDKGIKVTTIAVALGVTALHAYLGVRNTRVALRQGRVHPR